MRSILLQKVGTFQLFATQYASNTGFSRFAIVLSISKTFSKWNRPSLLWVQSIKGKRTFGEELRQIYDNYCRQDTQYNCPCPWGRVRNSFRDFENEALHWQTICQIFRPSCRPASCHNFMSQWWVSGIWNTDLML